MLNAGALAFILAGSLWQQADGQVIYILILSVAAAEVGLGLALLIRLREHIGNLDIDKLDDLRG
jgi:NADH-quinone oxidoreductase subunit K